jgi:hypothetical protein
MSTVPPGGFGFDVVEPPFVFEPEPEPEPELELPE